MTTENYFSFTDENGKLRTKEQILADIGVVYDDYVKQEKDSFFDLITDEESHIDIEETFKTEHFASRVYYINSDISDKTAQELFEFINFFNKVDFADEVPVEERMPIKILINTNGGDLDAGFSIISAIKSSKTPVWTYNIGKAWSCGFFVLISGDKRYGIPLGSYLFHEGSIASSGDAHKFVQQADFYKEQLKQIQKFVLSNTDITEEYYNEHKPDDLWFTTERALKLGIIDEIITNMEVI